MFPRVPALRPLVPPPPHPRLRAADLQVARQLLSSKEIARIWERGEYNEDEQTWVLPRIKPRASYIGDPCKLPLLAPPGSGSGSRASVSIGGGSAAGSGGGSGSGSRASVSGKEGGSAKRRRSVVGGGRGGGEERPPRRLGEETAPKEGGGGKGRGLKVPRAFGERDQVYSVAVAVLRLVGLVVCGWSSVGVRSGNGNRKRSQIRFDADTTTS